MQPLPGQHCNTNKPLKESFSQRSHLLIIDKKKTFLSKRKALKGEKIYLDDDLTPTQVAHHKENMPTKCMNYLAKGRISEAY